MREDDDVCLLQIVFIGGILLLHHGCLLSLNAWKLGPTPRNFEMVSKPHSNGLDNRCP